MLDALNPICQRRARRGEGERRLVTGKRTSRRSPYQRAGTPSAARRDIPILKMLPIYFVGEREHRFLGGSGREDRPNNPASKVATAASVACISQSGADIRQQGDTPASCYSHFPPDLCLSAPPSLLSESANDLIRIPPSSLACSARNMPKFGREKGDTKRSG